jgi:hypothetical protein
MATVWSARAARKTPESTGIEPDHRVQDFRELAEILRSRYGIRLDPF